MIRRTVSLTLSISFILVLVSSVVLYILPEGRVAYWSNWSCLGLSKEQWGALHITGGVLFLLAGLWHTLLNIRPVISYMKGKQKGGFVPLCASLVLCAVVYGGTLGGWQPMQGIMDLNASIKRAQEAKHGNPPYGHAENSSLSDFCTFLRLDTAAVVEGLRNSGLKGQINGKTTLKSVAINNDMPPSKLYQIILKVSGLTEADIQKMKSSGGKKGQGKGKGQGQPQQ